jgi:hypothetical protein
MSMLRNDAPAAPAEPVVPRKPAVVHDTHKRAKRDADWGQDPHGPTTFSPFQQTSAEMHPNWVGELTYAT